MKPFGYSGPKGRSNPKSRILQQWRGGIDWPTLDREWTSKTAPIEGVVSRVLSDIRIDQRVAEGQIVKIWREIIDPTITAHAQPVNLAKGTLFISVDSNVWLAELVRYRRHEILERLQLAVGKDRVQKLAFRVG